MFFINRGAVRVFVLSDPDENGYTPPEETYVISLGAGSFFGEVALLEEVCRKLDAHRRCPVAHPLRVPGTPQHVKNLQPTGIIGRTAN